MVTPAQVRSWRPDRLVGIADELVAHRRVLVEQTDELAFGRVPTSWTFASARAAAKAHAELADALAVQVAEVTRVITALETAAVAIRAAKGDLEGALEAADRNVDLAVDRDTGAVRVTGRFETADQARHASIMQNQLSHQIETALAAAAAADQNLAAVLTVAVNTDSNTLGTLGQQREILAFQQLSAAGQAQYLLDHPGSYAFLDDHTSAEVKARVGRAIADQLDDVADDNGLFNDPAWVARSSELLSAFGAYPEVMAATYDSVGADGLMATLGGLSSSMYHGMNAEALEGLANGLRDGLATATRHPGFDGEAYGRELVEYATYTGDGPIYGPRGDLTSAGRIASLDFLMREGEYGEGFVRGVAWELDEFERANPILASHLAEMDTYDSPLNHLDGGTVCDPMARVMGQLGKHPELGLEFFSDGEDAEARKDYYFAERDWTRDGFAGVSEMALAVGTDPDNMANSHRDTSLFVSEFFTRIAENPDFTPHLATAGSESVGQLLGAYMPPVWSAIAFGSSPMTSGGFVDVETFDGLLRGCPMVNGEHLESLMQVALSTEDGSNRIAEGIANYRQGELHAFARSGEAMVQGQVNEELQRIMERSAQLEGYAQNVAGHLEIDDGATKQQRVAALTQMISDAASLCPNTGVQAVGLVVSHIEPGYLDDALDHANEEAQVGIEGIQMTSVQSLIQAGLIPPPSSDWMHDGRPVSLRDIAASGDWQDYGNDADGALTGVLRISDIKSEYQDPFRPWRFHDSDPDVD